MPEESKYVKYEYNGQMLTLHAIAELEGVNDSVLRNRYKEENDIYEAVRLAKEGKTKKQENTIQVLYNGQILSVNAIAKLEGLTDSALRNRYKEENDIYKAVKLAKEAQQKEKDRITQIPYNGQILSLAAIAKLEGISHNNLTKKYKKANDIYEAVRLAKEGKTKQQESVTQLPYNGQILSLNAIAKLEGISGDTLTKKYEKTNDIHEAVKLAKEAKGTIEYKGEKRTLHAISKLEGVTYKTLTEKYEKTKDIQEAIRLTKEGHKKAEESISQIPYEDKILSFGAIAKLEKISPDALRNNYKETQDIYAAVKLTKESQAAAKARITQIPYNGQILTITAIAKMEGTTVKTLTKKFEKTKDINKAVMLCKLIRSRLERRNEIVKTKEFGNLTYYDISLIIGIKYSELEKLLEQGNSIDDIIASKESNSRNDTIRKSIKLENGQSLKEYCIENKINYSCIYRAMKIYGKTLEEAVSTYNAQGQSTPKSWIFEKYGLLLRHLMLKESVDIDKIVSYMRKNYFPLEEAVKKYIIRTNAKKEKIDEDWMEELYDILSDDSISKEDYDGYVQTFYVDEQEKDCINKSKEQYTNIKRKLLLFELSEVLQEELFTQEEEKRLFEEYNITEDEVDIIFKDLYKRFTDPGVLMGKDQKEVITPEYEQNRDKKINKYKQMVREIKEDNNIMFVMRFMVGSNVESNQECRNEIHKELAKEEMKKQDISSNN